GQCNPYNGVFNWAHCPDTLTVGPFPAGWVLSNQIRYSWTWSTYPGSVTPVGPTDQKTITLAVAPTFGLNQFVQLQVTGFIHDSTNNCDDMSLAVIDLPQYWNWTIFGPTDVGCDTSTVHRYTWEYPHDGQFYGYMVNWTVEGGVIENLIQAPSPGGSKYDTIDVRWTSAGPKRLVAHSYYSGPIGPHGGQYTCNTYEHALVITDQTPYITGPQFVCNSNAASYSAPLQGDSIVWSVTGGTFSGPNTGSNVQVIWNGSGTLIATTYDDNCTYHDTIAVNFNQPLQPDIGSDTTLCDGDQIVLFANPGNYASYNWSTGSTNSTSVITTSQSVAVTVTNNFGCSGTDNATITFQPPPSPNFSVSGGPNTYTFTDQSTGSYTSQLWDFGDGNTSTAANPSHTYTTPGDYQVCLTLDGPCLVTHCDSVSIAVSTLPAISSGWTFAPNPAQDLLRLRQDAPLTDGAQFTIFDLSGRPATHPHHILPGGRTAEIDLHSLPAGMYLLQRKDVNGEEWRRVVVE
ncbi:MAG: PKD domain-containing protein, partial [Bacteroidota bacterium]